MLYLFLRWNRRFQSPVSIAQIQDIQHRANDLGDYGEDRKIPGNDDCDVAGDHPQQITHKKNNSTHHIQLPHHDAAVNQIFRGSRFFQ